MNTAPTICRSSASQKLKRLSLPECQAALIPGEEIAVTAELRGLSMAVT